MEISHKDLKTTMLSYKALALLSEFALIWYAKTGELIDVDSDDALTQVFRNANRSNNRRLQSIYLHLRTELSMKLEYSLPYRDTMLIDQLLLRVAATLNIHHAPCTKATI